MSIEQPEFEIEIDADLDRKADDSIDELLKFFQGNFDYVVEFFHGNYDDVVNFLLESTSDAVLSNDIHYKARLYNMLVQKTNTKDLFLPSVVNYKARLYALALEKIKLDCSKTAILIKHINDKLPTDLVTLLTKLIQNCTTLKKVIFDSISDDTNNLMLLDAVVANTKIEEIIIRKSAISDVIIPKILNKSLKVLNVGILKTGHYFGRYAFEWCCNQDQSAKVTLHNINNNTARLCANFSPKIVVRNVVIAGDDEELDDAPQLMHFIRNSESLESVELLSVSNEKVARELLKAAAQNVNITKIYAYDVPPVKDLIPTLLETSKSLKRLKINETSYYECRNYGDGETAKQSVRINCFNNDTDRICGKLLQRINVSGLHISSYDEVLDDAPQLIHFIQNSSSLEFIELQYMSNERVLRELLKAAAQNVKITKISISPISPISPYYEMPPIQDIIPTLLETSKSLTHLSMCCFSLDCSELGKETVSIYDVDNRTIPFYVQALTKRRLTELEIISDNGLDDGSLLIDWIKHSASLKMFRCHSIRNEVVCRELLEAAVSNPNVEHLYLKGKCIRFLSIVLNQSKSLRCLELDEVAYAFDDEVLFEKDHLLGLFRGENTHAQSRSNIEKLVLHCYFDRHFENVVTCLKENGTAGTFFNTVELKLKIIWYAYRDRLVSSLPTMRGVHELEICHYDDYDANADDEFFIAIRKNFCLGRLDFPKGKLLEFQNDIKMLCKRNKTIDKPLYGLAPANSLFQFSRFFVHCSTNHTLTLFYNTFPSIEDFPSPYSRYTGSLVK